MPESDAAHAPSVLARIIAVHAGLGPDRPDPTGDLTRGLTRAIRRAAMPFNGFSPILGDIAVIRDQSLGDAQAAMPDHGLIAAIEDEDGRRGLIALDNGLVDALIEVQTTGAVEATELPPRKLTRIDEALCRDFIDLLFASFAAEVAEVKTRDWPQRLGYGSHIPDLAQLNLLLPDRALHNIRVEIALGSGRNGALTLCLPVDPALARQSLLARKDAPQPAPRSADWGERVLAVLADAPLALDAVLMRLTLPLSEVEALADGTLLPFDPAELSSVSLEGEGGHVFIKGHLGQYGGRRAVRLGAGDGAQPGGAARAAGTGAVAGAGGVPQMADMATGAIEPDQPGGLPGLPDPAPAPGLPDLPDMPGLDPNAPIGDFDPTAPMGDFDPNAPMGGFDPNAPIGGDEGLPQLPAMADFDPNAPMG